MPDKLKDGVWGLLIMCLLLIGTVVVMYVWYEIFGEKREINPSIRPAIITELDKCRAEEWPNETVKCVAALKKEVKCYPSEDCTVQEMYEVMVRLGFDLPPLYQGLSPKKR